MIWVSVRLFFFIRTSSLTLPRKFHFRPTSENGEGLPALAGTAVCLLGSAVILLLQRG